MSFSNPRSHKLAWHAWRKGGGSEVAAWRRSQKDAPVAREQPRLMSECHKYSPFTRAATFSSVFYGGPHPLRATWSSANAAITKGTTGACLTACQWDKHFPQERRMLKRGTFSHFVHWAMWSFQAIKWAQFYPHCKPAVIQCQQRDPCPHMRKAWRQPDCCSQLFWKHSSNKRMNSSQCFKMPANIPRWAGHS